MHCNVMNIVIPSKGISNKINTCFRLTKPSFSTALCTCDLVSIRAHAKKNPGAWQHRRNVEGTSQSPWPVYYPLLGSYGDLHKAHVSLREHVMNIQYSPWANLACACVRQAQGKGLLPMGVASNWLPVPHPPVHTSIDRLPPTK